MKQRFPSFNTFDFDDGFVCTSPVGSFKPNSFGLYDMTGNAWQWCEDYYGEYPADQVVNPTGPEKGTLRVLRGGSWSCHPKNCRIARRDWITADCRDHSIGFRVVLESE